MSNNKNRDPRENRPRMPFSPSEPIDPDKWPGDPPVILEKDIAEVIHTDVVVVGGGHAGLHCALSAVENEINVIVIEKKNQEKMTWFGEQIGTYNSRFLTEKGFGGYDEDEIIEEYCKCGNYYVSRTIEFGPEGYEVRNCSLTERETGKVYGSHTLVELAGFLGYEGKRKDTFLKSVERYNELCNNKYDTDFGKDPETLLPLDSPPYYGGYTALPPRDWRHEPRYAGRLAGLHTDNDMCVVDNKCNPIEGLYAVGNNLGYLRAVFYATPCGGNFIGMAMTHGRVLGKHLAARH